MKLLCIERRELRYIRRFDSMYYRNFFGHKDVFSFDLNINQKTSSSCIITSRHSHINEHILDMQAYYVDKDDYDFFSFLVAMHKIITNIIAEVRHLTHSYTIELQLYTNEDV